MKVVIENGVEMLCPESDQENRDGIGKRIQKGKP